VSFDRAHSCFPCRYAGTGENRLVRCLHPKANTPEFRTHLRTNASANTDRWSFPDAFDSLGLDGCDHFTRTGASA